MSDDIWTDAEKHIAREAANYALEGLRDEFLAERHAKLAASAAKMNEGFDLPTGMAYLRDCLVMLSSIRIAAPAVSASVAPIRGAVPIFDAAVETYKGQYLDNAMSVCTALAGHITSSMPDKPVESAQACGAVAHAVAEMFALGGEADFGARLASAMEAIALEPAAGPARAAAPSRARL